jgi:hypothetical protein
MGTVSISLTQGKAAIIDAADAALVGQYRWYADVGHATYYARTNIRNEHGGRRSLKMHRLLMGEPVGMFVDHISGDGLDNRRCNLRVISQAENNRNVVHFHKKIQRARREEQAAIFTNDGRARIPLVGERGRGMFVLLDAADVPLAQEYRWYVSTFKHLLYATAYERRTQRVTSLHRVLMQPADGLVVDHIDGNGLNCTRDNMRVVSQRANTRNRKAKPFGTSRYKGVSYRAVVNKWEAGIRTDNGDLYLGQFPTEDDAGRAYDSAAHHFFGEHARFNFPLEVPRMYAPRVPLRNRRS